MSNQFHEQSPRPAQPKKARGILFWFCMGLGTLTLLCCSGGVIGLGYIGVVAPDTSVYVGDKLPKRFAKIAEDSGAIKPGEKIQYFYSAAFLDASEEFCLVTKDKVVIYNGDGQEELQIIEFSQIESAELVRSESFFEDSVIWLELNNGEDAWLYVSSELDRDKDFFDVIEKGVADKKINRSY